MPLHRTEARAAPAAPSSFVVGRDREGHWIALETHGRGGGYFASRADANHFAEFETDRRPGAVQEVGEPIGLPLH